MCPIAYGVAYLCLLATVKSAPAFELDRCAANATDIVVVTPDGRVLESWRGELKPGDVVRLGTATLTPANALPFEWVRMRPDHSVSGFYQSLQHLTADRGWRGFYEPELSFADVFLWTGVSNCNREPLHLVLFLRKGGTSGTGTVWMPAAEPITHRNPHSHYQPGFQPFTAGRFAGYVKPQPPIFDCRNPNDFTSSVACLEGGRVVARRNGQTVRRAPGPNEFRKEVLARPAPPAQTAQWNELPERSQLGAPADLLLGSHR